MNTAICLMFLLFTKHFIVDFPLQTKYQYLNKGTYGHPGGLIHSALHGWATWGCILILGLPFGPEIALTDFMIHYHVDWAKMNLNKKLGWGPTTSEQFWWLLGLDQWLHALTYIGIVYVLSQL